MAIADADRAAPRFVGTIKPVPVALHVKSDKMPELKRETFTA